MDCGGVGRGGRGGLRSMSGVCRDYHECPGSIVTLLVWIYLVFFFCLKV